MNNIETLDVCCKITEKEKKVLEEILKQMSEILSQNDPLHYKKGHIIFYEGHNPLGFYFLKKGEIALSRTGLQEDQEIISTFNNGPFGLFHLLTNTPHCATATAKTNVEVFFVPKSVVLYFFKSSPRENNGCQKKSL